MGMTTTLFNNPEPFEQNVNIPSTEGLAWNLVKICQVVLEKKTFKDFMVLYLYKAQGQRGKILILTKTFTTLIILCKFQPLVQNIYWKKKKKKKKKKKWFSTLPPPHPPPHPTPSTNL